MKLLDLKRPDVRPEALFGVLSCLLLGVFPLTVHDYSAITRFKFLQMILLTAVCVLCALVFSPSWIPGFAWKNPGRIVGCLYFLLVILSAFFGSYADRIGSDGTRTVLLGALRYEGLVTQVCYGLLFLIFSLHAPRREMTVWSVAVSLTVYVGIVLGQYHGRNVLDLFPTGRSTMSNYEFQGTLGNIDMVSGYLTLMIPLLLVPCMLGQCHPFLLFSGLLGVFLEGLMEVQSGLLAMGVLFAVAGMLFLLKVSCRRQTLIVMGGMMLTLALRSMLALPWLDGSESLRLTFSVKAALLLAGAMVFLLFAAFWPRLRHPVWQRAMPGRRAALLAALILLAALALIWLLPLTERNGGLYELHEMLNGHTEDAFGSWRIGVWRHTLGMSRESLWFGTGPDLFYYAMKDYLTKVGATLGENYDNPHNIYLAVLSGSGLPALIAYLALLALLLMRSFRSRDGFRFSLGVSVLLYSIQGFFSFSICLVSPMAWAIFGMALSEDQPKGGTDVDLCSPTEGTREGRHAEKSAVCASGDASRNASLHSVSAVCESVSDERSPCVCAVSVR